MHTLLTAQATPTKPEACGLPRRLAAMLYDTIILLALLMLATAVAMLLGFRELSMLEDPLYALYLVSVCFLYLAWCWRRGMTVGMRTWRFRIENDSGGTPGWGRCLARFCTALLSLAALGMGFAWALFDDRKRAWHDILSGTRLRRF